MGKWSIPEREVYAKGYARGNREICVITSYFDDFFGSVKMGAVDYNSWKSIGKFMNWK